MEYQTTLPELADYLNREPPIFMGCTQGEIFMVTFLAIVGGLPVLVIVGVSTGFLIGVIVYLLTFLGAGCLGLTFLRRYKNGRPPGYYQVKWLLLKNRILERDTLLVMTYRFGRNKRFFANEK